MTGEGQSKLPIRLIAVIAAAAALVVALAWMFGGSGGSDSFYDKSAENPILPPGVRPGEKPPSAINPSTGAPSSTETGGR
jgi:hypothetical protein